MKYHYSNADLVLCWKNLKIKKGDVIYVTGSLLNLGDYDKAENILEDYYKTLQSAIGKEGTLVFPTHSWRTKSKKNFFDLQKTPSECGALSEYLRKKKNSLRQFHPLSSVSAIGRNAKYLTKFETRHAYGPGSPFEKLIQLDAKFISIGIKPNFTCSQVHHAEILTSVPYRFTKEFNINIKKKIMKKEKFYLYVLYNSIKSNMRDRNRKIFKYFLKNFNILKANLGCGSVYSYSIREFHSSTMDLMKKNVYCWLKNEPKKKDWV